ncbi:MAG: hypothetical protein R2692_09465 [Microbacterium sp.]
MPGRRRCAGGGRRFHPHRRRRLGVGALTDEGVYDQASDIIDALGTAISSSRPALPDGVSARVRVETVWHPPVLTVFVPDGWTIEATATSRTALC